jgi:hypothetical protein
MDPIKATCEKCGGKVYLVLTNTGLTIPIENPRHVVYHRFENNGTWAASQEGYAIHVCKEKKSL